MKIVVIAGGLSPERDVSLSSGCLIADALIGIGYEACLIDLYTGAEILKSGTKYNYAVPENEPDLDKLKREANNGESLIGPNVIELCRSADLVFIALHGDIGENGKLQAVFDSFGILYTGTGYTGSLLAMDKDLAKSIMVQHNILTPDWHIIYNADSPPPDAELPCVVKPCGCGSSVGISIVKTKEDYKAALECAGKYENKIIVEKMIAGREFTVGILGSQALPVIEIIPKEGFFDYKNKYQPGATLEICPAEIRGETADKMQAIALQVHKALQLYSYSRIDFMVDGAGNIFCLEANTLPGMTPTSLLPTGAAAAGISYGELCDRIIQTALQNKYKGGNTYG